MLEQFAGAAGEVRQEPAGVDHHVGVETPQRCGHHRPGLLIGGGPLDAREAEEHGQTTGEMVDVVPDGIGGERAPGRGEERRETGGDGRAVARGQVAPEGIGFDQEDLPTARPSGGEGEGGRGDAGRSLDRCQGDDAHLCPSPTSARPS